MFSVSCFENALITLLPDRFSRLIKPILSSFFCIAAYTGTLSFIIKNNVRAMSAAAAKKISDILRLIVIVIISEPPIMNGARVRSLIDIAMLCWT